MRFWRRLRCAILSAAPKTNCATNVGDSGRPSVGRSQGTKLNRRRPPAMIRSNSVTPPCCPQTLIAPVFSRSVGCELNRASHPSGSSVLRYPATALAAFATPEKRWCQAVSKRGTFAWLSRWRRQSAAGSRLGRFRNMHSIRWRKDGIQSFEVVVHQTALLAHRLWPGRYAKHRFTSKGFCSRSMW